MMIRVLIRIYAGVLVTAGLVLIIDGYYLLTLQGSPYYFSSGIGLVASGLLLWWGRGEGVTLYAQIECGDHYARSMASYGAYIAACGFEYHGPKGYLGFDPRLKLEDFKGAFTAANGWGSFAQTIESGTQGATIDLRWGTLRLKARALRSPEQVTPTRVAVSVNGHNEPTHLKLLDGRVLINLARETRIKAGERIAAELS